jgi:hypothetical protein
MAVFGHFWGFLSPGGSVWADSFWNASEISCIKFRHPTNGISTKEMFDPPSGGGQTLFLGDFSALGGQIGLIPFAMSQICLASSLDTLQRVSSWENVCPPLSGGGQTLFSGVGSALWGRIRLITRASSLDTPHSVSWSKKWLTNFCHPPPPLPKLVKIFVLKIYYQLLILSLFYF